MLNIFSCASWPSVYLLWGIICLIFCPFLIGLFVFCDIKSHELFVKFGDKCLVGHIISIVFSQFLYSLFIYLWFLNCTKTFSLVLICSFLFLFPLFLEIDHKYIAAVFVKSVLPMFSSKSFIVCGLTFRSLIYVKLIFVYGFKEFSNFIFFLTCSCPVFLAPFIEGTVFSSFL